MAHDVFISYSHRDEAAANAACARLEQAGYRCWIAPRDIGGGEWGKAIIEGIRGAKLFVLIFSGHANRSPQVNREVERAVNHGLLIVPFRIEEIKPSDALEYFISNQQWVDGLPPPIEKHLDRLSAFVGRLLGGSAPQPPVDTQGTERPGRRPWLAGAGLAALAAAAIGTWVYVSRLGPDSLPTSGAVPGPASNAVAASELQLKRQPVPGAPMPTPTTSEPAGITLLDFASIRTDRAPGNRVAAPPYLHEAAVPIRVTEVLPAGSRLVFMSNSEWYGGNAARPTVSENFLTLDVPAVISSSFTLEFDVPLAELSFTVPALFPASASGITFPAFSATAFDGSGQQIAQVGRAYVSSYVDVPMRTFSLRSRGGEAIVRVVFSSDPQGTAAFRAVLIEQMTYRPMGTRGG